MRRKIDISLELEELAGLFNAPLYITGGYVRNSLLKLPAYDTDLASSLLPEEVIALLRNRFRIERINKKLGTLKIIGSEQSYEYTAFRKDIYTKGSGAHKPSKVEFVNDIASDARRRDFSVNAIYYDIINNDLIDVCGGIEDIKNKIIRTTVDPYKVFSEDGLRILRLIRLAQELNFNIDDKAYAAARDNVELLNDIACERIKEEFIRILFSDKKYNINPYSHYKGIMALNEIGALKIIFKGLNLSNVEIIKFADEKMRLEALIIPNENTIEAISEALKAFPKRALLRILRLKRLWDDIGSENELKTYIMNRDIIDTYLKLLILNGFSERSENYYKIINYIEDNALPYSINTLKVKGGDLIEFNIPKENRARALNELLFMSIEEKANTKEAQIKLLQERIL